ncbi:MAG TPA: AMP-binding protein [Bryobacteraceae bacterium]|nr:AMP-binding protein [Bryobacteraceae bacterium]
MSASVFPDRRDIEAMQLAKLRVLLAALTPCNRFYSAKLGTAGLSSDVAGVDEFCRRMPFTRKQDLIDDQLANPPFGSNLTDPLERYTRFCQTSATTGQPMRWLDTPESWNWMLGNWSHVFRAAEVTAQDRIFFAFSFGPFLGFWTAFEAAARMGAMCIPGGGMRSVARLRTLLDTEATVLCCTPTYAIRLAEVAADENIDLTKSRVRRIIVAGEGGGSIPGTRAHIERLWPGATVWDHHGMTETGPVSYGCPKRPGVLHVIESEYIAEVIDTESGRAVPPHGTGELVLTNLGRIASPLLRYRTGDVVERGVDSRCDCGSCEMALEGGILGRTDDMVVVRGVNVYPSAVEDIVRTVGGVAEYRVEIRADRAMPELSLRFEPYPESLDGADLAHRLETALRNAFSLRIPATGVPCGTLPRFEMKAQRWVRL